MVIGKDFKTYNSLRRIKMIMKKRQIIFNPHLKQVYNIQKVHKKFVFNHF